METEQTENKVKVIVFHNYEERQEIVQDVIDRLLSVPGYKEKLLKLNAEKENTPLIDYNRRLEKTRAGLGARAAGQQYS